MKAIDRHLLRIAIDHASRINAKKQDGSKRGSSHPSMTLLCALAPRGDATSLTDDEREAWTDMFILGRSHAAIGRSMGFSREHARHLIAQAQRKLKRHYIENGLADEDVAA